MVGLIFPTPGLIMGGGSGAIELISSEVSTSIAAVTSETLSFTNDPSSSQSSIALAGAYTTTTVGTPTLEIEDDASTPITATYTTKTVDQFVGVSRKVGAITNPDVVAETFDSNLEAIQIAHLIVSNISGVEDSDTQNIGNSTGTLSGTVNTVAGGFVVAVAYGRGPQTVTWTNATEEVANTVTSNESRDLRLHVAYAENVSAGSLTVSATVGNRWDLHVVSFN